MMKQRKSLHKESLGRDDRKYVFQHKHNGIFVQGKHLHTNTKKLIPTFYIRSQVWCYRHFQFSVVYCLRLPQAHVSFIPLKHNAKYIRVNYLL